MSKQDRAEVLYRLIELKTQQLEGLIEEYVSLIEEIHNDSLKEVYCDD